MDKDKAREAKELYDSYQMVLSTPFGKRFFAKMREIEDIAIKQAMRGATPDTTNGMFESRGKVIAVQQLSSLAEDVKQKHGDALKWEQDNPPTEKPSEKTE